MFRIEYRGRIVPCSTTQSSISGLTRRRWKSRQLEITTLCWSTRSYVSSIKIFLARDTDKREQRERRA